MQVVHEIPCILPASITAQLSPINYPDQIPVILCMFSYWKFSDWGINNQGNRHENDKTPIALIFSVIILILFQNLCPHFSVSCASIKLSFCDKQLILGLDFNASRT